MMAGCLYMKGALQTQLGSEPRRKGEYIGLAGMVNYIGFMYDNHEVWYKPLIDIKVTGS